MSVSSILAFVLAGAAVKNRSVAGQDENRQELIALRVDNADLRRRVEELEGDLARANIQYRRDQELIDLWRARALANIPAPQIGLQQAAHALQGQTPYGQQALMNQQYAQMMESAQNMQPAQSVQNHGLAQQMQAQALQNGQLLGAQAINPELWCNCVPSRAQVWAADGAEA